jgi:parallel beta-helix repeat protein
MKTTENLKVTFLVLTVFVLCGSAFSVEEWTDPILLDELGDGEGNHAGHPSLSSDGLTMYFNRYIPSLGLKCIVEAYRDTPEGPFTSERVASELVTSVQVRAPRISDDELRLYYQEDGSGIVMAQRSSVGGTWTPTRIFDELSEDDTKAASPALSSDELIIVVHSNEKPGSAGGYDLWISTRTEPNGVFDSVTALDEINTSANEMQPHLLPDGLTLYFTSDRSDEYPGWNIYKATRSEPNEPFSDIDYWEGNTMDYDGGMHVTSDEQEVYFNSNGGGVDGIRFSRVVEVFHVDGVSGDDDDDGLTRGMAFATIQKGVDAAENWDRVIVWPATYDENVSFDGKAITVRSAAEPAVVSPTTGYAFEFFSAEGPDSVLKNFIIADGEYGIHVDVGCSPTITNLTIANNGFGISAVGNADPNITNCIFYNNTFGDIDGCEARYSWVQQEIMNPGGSIPEGAISRWEFDEGEGDITYDSVGDNDANIYGAEWVTGQYGGALNFDGEDDYVDLGTDSSLKPAFPITFSAWIKRLSTGASDAIVFLGRGSSNLYYGSWFNVSTDDKLTVAYGDGTGRGSSDRRTKKGTTTIGTGTWYHLAAIIRGALDMDLYINGQLEPGIYSGSGGSMVYKDPNASSFIGGVTFDNAVLSAFDGLIDEVAVWDRDLDTSEIEAIYDDGRITHNMGTDPLFADPNNGDYHLRSERGRYWPQYDVWVLDYQMSPGVDSGDPSQDVGDERMPNGGRINMGAYGGTAWASMTPGEYCQDWLLDADVNRDGIVNFLDLAIVIREWLSALPED